MAQQGVSRRRTASREWRSVVFWLVLTPTACATGQTGGMEGEYRTLITRDELASTTATDLYDAISRLRPLWLISGGPRSIALETEIAVIVDGSYFGGVQSLRGISPQGVQMIRHIGDAAEASAAMPRLTSSTAVEAAILITLAREAREE